MISSYNGFMIISLTVITFTILGIFYCRGKIGSIDDYLTARGSIGANMLSATLLASFLGVFILFTPPEAGVLGGIPAVTGYSLGVVGLYFAFLILGPKVRAYLPEGSSLAEYAHIRYGKKMHILTIIISIFYMFVHLVAELTAIGLVVFQLSEIPLLQTALLIGLGTMIYTAYGGLRASIFTDMIQMIFVIILLALATCGFIYYSGGVNVMTSQINSTVPQLLTFNNWSGIEYGLTLCIAVFVANLFHQGYWQRIYAGKDKNTLVKSLKLTIFIVFPIMFLAGFFGIISAGYGAAFIPSIAVFALAQSIFPVWLIIFLFVLALILVMSTVDTLLNAIVATLTLESKKYLNNDKEKLLKYARIITVFLILPAALIASRGYSVLYLFLVADMICAGIFFPLFYGLYYPSFSSKSAFFACILGIMSGIPFFIMGKLLLSFLVPILVSASICWMSTIVGNIRLAKKGFGFNRDL